MKFVGMVIFGLMLMNFNGCYTVIYHSADSETICEEPTYLDPIYIRVPDPKNPIYINPYFPVPDPYPMPAPYPNPVPNIPPEKIRHPETGDNGRDDSYSERDPLRNRSGRGTEERNNQGR